MIVQHELTTEIPGFIYHYRGAEITTQAKLRQPVFHISIAMNGCTHNLKDVSADDHGRALSNAVEFIDGVLGVEPIDPAQVALDELEQTISKLSALAQTQEPSETVAEWQGGAYKPALTGSGWVG